MSAPQKFMFDNAFDNKAEIVDPLAELKTKFEARIDKARKAAFEEGRNKGREEALETIENQSKQALETLNEQAQKLTAEYNSDLQRLEETAVEYGITAGSKLAGELIKKTPLPLIESFFKDAFSVIRGVPEVTARVHPSVFDQVREVKERWQAPSGHEGQINLIADPDLKVSDVSITWNDGGMERSVDKLMSAIQNAMTRFFEAKAKSQDTQISEPKTDSPGAVEEIEAQIEVAELQPISHTDESHSEPVT